MPLSGNRVWGFENERKSVKRESERDKEKERGQWLKGLRAKLESM